MATSPNSYGSAAIATLNGRMELLNMNMIYLQQRGASPILHFSPLKSFEAGADDVLRISICTKQASRLASFAVATTAWMGLSMSPLEALAMVYGPASHHENVGEWVVTGSINRNGSGKFIDDVDGYNLNGMPKMEMETTVGNVPSIKPPNEGLNSPWIPKMNGLKSNNVESKGRMMVKCPPWTVSELEMVLPDLQGKPKPFLRMQGHLYPFWPATTLDGRDDRTNDNNIINQQLNERVAAQASSLTAIDGGIHIIANDDVLGYTKNLAAPPAHEQAVKKGRGCFTM